jgi:uncharacterized protein
LLPLIRIKKPIDSILFPIAMESQKTPERIVDMEHDVSLERKLACLGLLSSYGEESGKVQAIETHMSWVFLTERHAYKLKKPVHYDLIDFRTLGARDFYCDEEIRLNRRLAPEVYIGKIPLTIDAGGNLHVDGEGTVVDWLVKMKRLPAGMMLDTRLAGGALNDEDAERVVSVLAGFYRTCSPAAISPENYVKKIETDLKDSRDVLCNKSYPLSEAVSHGIYKTQISVFRILQSELMQRVGEGKVVEGHGDLRPEHICLQEKVSIIDCLDFSALLRTQDMADELAFLALECERLHAPGFANALLRAYRVQMKDEVSPALVHFYQSYRAMARAKLAIRHLDEEQFRLSEKWIKRTNEYLTLATTHITQASEA